MWVPHRAKIKALAGLCSLLGLLKKNLLPCLFLKPPVAWFWSLPPSSKARSQRWRSSHSTSTWPSFLPPSSTSRDPCNYTRPTRIIQDNPPYVKVSWLSVLIPFAFFITLPYNLTQLQVIGLRTWTCLGPIILPTTVYDLWKSTVVQKVQKPYPIYIPLPSPFITKLCWIFFLYIH